MSFFETRYIYGYFLECNSEIGEMSVCVGCTASDSVIPHHSNHSLCTVDVARQTFPTAQGRPREKDRKHVPSLSLSLSSTTLLSDGVAHTV